MSGCGRQWCTSCSEELIHRDNRKLYESASALGQIVSREGPVNIGVTDIDAAAFKVLRSEDRLLRILEQKQPKHRLKWPQEPILKLLDAVLTHCKLCPTAAELRLDQRSGVYIIRGEIGAAVESIRHETVFGGPQVIERLSDGEKHQIGIPEELFRLLDPEDPRRRTRSAPKDRTS